MARILVLQIPDPKTDGEIPEQADELAPTLVRFLADTQADVQVYWPSAQLEAEINRQIAAGELPQEQ